MIDGTTVFDFVRELESGQRIRLSIEGWVNAEGLQKWTDTLTDAQILAYAEQIITHAHEKDGTWFCMIKSEQIAEG